MNKMNSSFFSKVVLSLGAFVALYTPSFASENNAPTFYVPSRVGTNLFSVGKTFDAAFSIAKDEKGYYLGGFSTFNRRDDFTIVRIKKNGELDTSFGNQTPRTGRSVFDFVNDTDKGLSVATFDGSIYLAGKVKTEFGDEDFGIVKIKQDGTADKSFGNSSPRNGKAMIHVGRTHDHLSDIKVYKSGIYLVGSSYTEEDYTIVKLNHDGSPDTSFGRIDEKTGLRTGKLFVNIGNDFDVACCVHVDNEGSIYVGGYSRDSNVNFHFSIAKLTPEGKLDIKFGDDNPRVKGSKTGKTIIPITKNNKTSTSMPYDMAVYEDKIYLIGESIFGAGDQPFSVVRLNIDGTLDKTFGNSEPKSGTSLIYVTTRGSNYGRGIVVNEKGIFVAGYSSINGFNNFAVVKLTNAGLLDKKFGDTKKKRGKTVIDVAGAEDNAWGIVSADDKGLVLVGNSVIESTNTEFSAAKIKPDGELDKSFGKLDNNKPENTLDGDIVYKAGSEGVVLDDNLVLFDLDLYELNNFAGDYGGVVLTLKRKGGRNSDDVFVGSGKLKFKTDGVEINGITVADHLQGGGVLQITFNSGTTQKQINAVASAVAYKNRAKSMLAEKIEIEWTMNDGNDGSQGKGGDLSAIGQTKVSLVPKTLSNGKIFDDSFETKN